MADNVKDTDQIDISNSVFQKAVSFVTHTYQNLFLTGKAGTGKTTFLKYIIKNCGKECAVVAPTGVAAINAGGETIHSFLQLPLGPFVPGNGGGFGRRADGTQDKHSLIANLRLRDTKIKLLRRLEVLIIDEVSMVRADVMDAIDLVLRHVRQNYGAPFGGLQVILIGDAFQLPPVAREEEWSILQEFYKGIYFFNSHVLTAHPPVYIELKKIYRQKDQVFIDLLNRVRYGDVTNEDIATLNERYQADTEREEGYITLCTHNHVADTINREALDEIDAPLHSFEGKVANEFNLKSVNAEEVLRLRKGAQVMFIKNDIQTPRRYYNGKIGKVSAINAGGIWVSFSDSDEPVTVSLETWKSIRYSLNRQTGRIEEEETGSFTQYPLKLAWAVTIHKSQGLTLERAIVDLNRSFASGQVYVALSRCTTLEGLILRNEIRRDNVIVDERVIEFAQNESEEDELAVVLEQSERLAQATMLQRKFSFDDLVKYAISQQPELLKRKTGPKEEGIVLLDNIIRSLQKAQKHAESFGRELQRLFETQDHKQLRLRKTAAVNYFADQVIAPAIKGIEAHFVLLETFPKITKQSKLWGALKLLLAEREKELRDILIYDL
jgi:hypothetical protein